MNKYLKQLLDALAAKQLEKQGVMTKALDAGNTPNEDEEKQIEAIDAEIVIIPKNLERVKEMIKAGENAAANGTPVAGQSEAEAAASAKGDPEPSKKKSAIALLNPIYQRVSVLPICPCKNVGMPCAKAG